MATFKEVSFAAIFQNQAEKLGERPCVSTKKDGKYVDLSWNEMNSLVHEYAYYLLSLGIKKGDRVGLFSPNRHEWWVGDLAIVSIGAVNVPIYATNSSEETLYILENSEAVACMAGTEDHLNRILKVKNKLKKVKKLIIFDQYSNKTPGVIDLGEAVKKGRMYNKKDEFVKRLKAIKPDDLASILYTSGTTGNPKGVMLTHNNFVSNVRNTLEGGIGKYMSPDDVFLSFLPLSHSLERMAGFYTAIEIGAKVAFAEDISKLMENFQEVRPTCMISVPRIYEKVHAGILSKVADAPGLKKAIFNFAVNAAKESLPYNCTDRPKTGLLKIKFNLADKLVFSKLKAALGMDRLRFAISGGGPLAVSDAEFFIGMGIKICEGFGLTETTPVTNYNRPNFIKPGTVGPAIPHTTVKIGDDGEILIKGPQVMKGYYKNPRATREVFTKDGFFRTGDIGRIDEDGFLSITGRIKDIIVTAGGKNISPQNIENSLKDSPYVEQVAVIGDRRKYLAALIIPAFDEVKKWCRKQGVVVENDSDCIKNKEVIKLIEGEVQKFTKHYARVEQIRKFSLLDAEWTQGSGELTPTQKVKRRVIEQKYSKEIEALYPPDLE